ncbi:MAG TPA: GNAT family N-acetyltransferase [Armatimonadota bacterium]|jgi:GNAT superfamily N-acetyltransferase
MRPFRNTLVYRLRSRLRRFLSGHAAFRRWRRSHGPVGLECRSVERGDLPLLANLYLEMRPRSSPEAAQQAAEEEWREASRQGALLLALRSGRPGGYLRGSRDGSGTWTIDGLYVARTERASGVAAALLSALEARARGDGAGALRTHVFERNAPAAAFFRSQGFLGGPGSGSEAGYLVLTRPVGRGGWAESPTGKRRE